MEEQRQSETETETERANTGCVPSWKQASSAQASGVGIPRVETEGSPGQTLIWLASWEPSVRICLLQQ